MIAVISALREELPRQNDGDGGIIYSTCGVGVERAIEHINRLITTHPINAICFVGSAGALDPDLPRGTIVVPRRLMRARHHRPSPLAPTIIELPALIDDSLLRQIAQIANTSVTRAPLLTVDAPVIETQQRHALHRQYRAGAVDMEAWSAGWVGHRAGLPLAVIKYVTDSTAGELRNFRTQLVECAATLQRVLPLVINDALFACATSNRMIG